MPILREAAPSATNVVDQDVDSDECEEWVANGDGGFSLMRPARSSSAHPLPTARPRSSWLRRGALFALLAVVLGALQRGRAFWCSARGIPLGTVLRAPGFRLSRMPDLHGRTALITGANTGLGLEVARQLALARARVVLACRDAAKCDAAASDVRAAAGLRLDDSSDAVQTVRLDLSDLRAVLGCAAALDRQLRSLHILVLNAGVAAQFPTARTVDGVERTYQANYLGHFALATRLLPLLERTARRERRPSRVVHLTSGAHRGAPAEGVPLSLERINGPMGAYARYGMAKLASLAFSNELARRYRPPPAGAPAHPPGDAAPPPPLVLSNAVHPGVVATEMLRPGNFASMLGPSLGRAAWLVAQARNLLFAYSPRTAAVTVLYAAAADEVEAERLTGALLVPIATRWTPHHPMATDAAFGRALWDHSERLVRDATGQSWWWW